MSNSHRPQFPDISEYLEPTASCQQAVEVNGGRNLAQVLLDIYNLIPQDQTEFKQEYATTIAHYLDGNVNYKAPELFPSIVWPQAINIILKLFDIESHPQDNWRIRCLSLLKGG